jgi:hypothetical protein
MEAKDHSPIGRKLESIARTILCGNWPKARVMSALVACSVCGLLLCWLGIEIEAGRQDLQFSYGLMVGFAFVGIILAIGISMHRFVQRNFGEEVSLIQIQIHSARSAGMLAISRRMALCPAVTRLQGGRWTKDWCGGDQDWRTRLSGRGWTDRRRSG